MYKISVPIMINDLLDMKAVLRQLKKVKASRVFLVLRERRTETFTLSNEELDEIEKLVHFFESNGIEAGIWFGETLGHTPEGRAHTHQYTKPVNSKGETLSKEFCPLDGEFTQDFCKTVKMVAARGVRIILLDDDFCMLSRAMAGDFCIHEDSNLLCFCEHHMKMYKEILNSEVTREEIAANVLSGKPNPYRSAWLKVMNHTLRSLAKKLRDTVDEVSPRTRIGLCASPSSWDIDGIDAIELTKVLAGDTKPLLRLIGAPYWVLREYPLSKVVEYERLQQYWAADKGVEIIAEGDSYPRPRFMISAARLELFDIAMRASGTSNGILKYMLDYCSSCDYEQGYINRCVENLELYDKVDKIFTDKKAVGINVYERMRLLENSNLSGEMFAKFPIYPLSQWLLCDNSLPITYGEDSAPTVVFGENARYLERFDQGLILNLHAAKILTERGIDVGLADIGKRIEPQVEYYFEYNERVAVGWGLDIYEVTVRDGAKVLTQLCEEPELVYTGAYEYENKDGQRFLVYPFGTGEPFNVRSLFRSYCRQQQLLKSVKWLGGRVPAYCFGNPDLYILCKEDDHSLSVGLWNIFEDGIQKPVIQLDRSYNTISFVNCSGRLSGNTVELSYMEPFSFAAFEVKL